MMRSFTYHVIFAFLLSFSGGVIGATGDSTDTDNNPAATTTDPSASQTSGSGTTPSSGQTIGSSTPTSTSDPSSNSANSATPESNASNDSTASSTSNTSSASSASNDASPAVTTYPPVFWPQVSRAPKSFPVSLQTILSPQETVFIANPCLYERHPYDCPLTLTTGPSTWVVSRTTGYSVYATTCSGLADSGAATCTEVLQPAPDIPGGGIGFKESVETLVNHAVSVYSGSITTGTPFPTPTDMPKPGETVSIHFPIPIWQQYGHGGYQQVQATPVPTVYASVINSDSDAMTYGLAPCSKWDKNIHCPLGAQDGVTITAGLSTFEWSNVITYSKKKKDKLATATETTACSVVPQVTGQCFIKGWDNGAWKYMNPVPAAELKPIPLVVVQGKPDVPSYAASAVAGVSASTVGLLVLATALTLV